MGAFTGGLEGLSIAIKPATKIASGQAMRI